MSTYRCKVFGTLGGILPWSTAIHVSGATAEGTLSTDFTNAITALWTTATNGLENFMSADVEVTGTEVVTLNATMHQTTGTLATLAISGTDANASLPWNIAEIVTLRSPQRTKWGHGRMFLPPFAEDQVASHVIIAATMTKMALVFNTFFASLATAGVQPFIYNARPRKDGTPAFTITNLTFYDLSNKPAQQRRRVSKLVPARTIGTF